MSRHLEGRSLGKQNVRRIQHVLRDVIAAASLENADFNRADCGQTQAAKTLTIDVTRDMTTVIRAEVSSHHTSWIIRPLTELLDQLEAYA